MSHPANWSNERSSMHLQRDASARLSPWLVLRSEKEKERERERERDTSMRSKYLAIRTTSIRYPHAHFPRLTMCAPETIKHPTDEAFFAKPGFGY